MSHLKPISIAIRIFFLLILPIISLFAQSEVNYSESAVPAFVLPDPLIDPKTSTKIKSVEFWESTQRKVLLQSFAREMYGTFPDQNLEVDFILNSNQQVFDNTAVRKEVTINIKGQGKEKDITLLVYLPNAKSNVPVFLGLNFYGNHTIHDDPGITIHRSWVPNNEAFEISNNRASEKNRGVRSNRWPVEYLLEQGYGLATIYYGEIDPDFDDNFENGIHALLDQTTDKRTLSSISAWAWALSQALTYLQQDPDIAADQVAVIGHSRLGKAALWAGASDSRFAMVISNDSGCGGAALSRRRFGETVNRINHSFPHWFCEAFDRYNNEENLLPFDQHTLLSLIARRPLYVASAVDDQWADPRGEFLAASYASPAYRLYNYNGLNDAEMPDVDRPLLSDQVAYHIRSGGHDITLYDWQQFVHFANQHFGKK
ncbi:MAG: acetylxylan esterase [Saprospiraceae bacterium]|nr:acetylxylan esterase [Saprospiraceae bacterium]